MSTNDLPNDCRFTKDHEWARTEDGDLVVGITRFAVDQLGDITLVSIDAKVGAHIDEGKPFGTIESVKTLSDLFAPVSGTVTKINAALDAKPELVNDDCYGAAWMIAIKPDAADAANALLDKAAYAAHCEAAH
jgi:glycine cleavage system H protein